jgi:hypothetical protein
LRVYCAVCFAIGLLVSVPLANLVHVHELTQNAAAILTLCLNVLLLLVSPLVLDWSERKYFKARFVQLEELAQTNPELKAILEQKCEQLSLPGLRLAAVESASSESFVYGLWKHNPRLVVPASWLQPNPEESARIVPSIEVELNKFAKRDVSFIFLLFVAVQVAMQYALVNLVLR